MVTDHYHHHNHHQGKTSSVNANTSNTVLTKILDVQENLLLHVHVWPPGAQVSTPVWPGALVVREGRPGLRRVESVVVEAQNPSPRAM